MRRFAAQLLRRLADRVEGCVRNRHPGGVAACTCRGCRAMKRQVRVQLTAEMGEFERAMARAKETLSRYGYATDPWPYAHVRQGEQPDPLAPPPKRGHGSDTTVPSAHVPPPRDSGATHTTSQRR